ncbi:FAD-dependent oxidoreductase [Arthrobacter sp. ATA002]|uniref:FAD-dependent oxidoreductase n=1 Tax=Arthrobacter sp. ATA002 TaxID=2991715 RepID=UPI0022A7FB87|nr:FAD-dependent oxidoreductase [Arthrobacter sp. ATA002]WAP50716.1 FAD-dependent oxidoreductase [Arthrobacter sp. ATA002]
MDRIVVVGNGIAGLTACDSLRSAGFDGDLTVVGTEQHQPYSRPALSKALLHDGGLTAHELPDPSHGATEMLGVSADGLDPEARIVRLAGEGDCRMTAWSLLPGPGRNGLRRSTTPAGPGRLRVN